MVSGGALDLLWLIPVLPLLGFLVAGTGTLLRARSKGAFFNRVLRGKFAFEKVEQA